MDAEEDFDAEALPEEVLPEFASEQLRLPTVASKGIPAEWHRQLAGLSFGSRPGAKLGQRARLCGCCWRLSSQGEGGHGQRWMCKACLERQRLMAELRRCRSCEKIDMEDRGQLAGSRGWYCGSCSGASTSGLGHHHLAEARVLGCSSESLDIEVPGRARHRLAWSLLQPLPKPALEQGLARAKWRFHCVDLDDGPSDFCAGPENRWEVECSRSPSSSSSGLRWRTGHLDVTVSLPDDGCCKVQLHALGAERVQEPQLLCLAPQVHLCLEHRAEPLRCFRRRCGMYGETEAQWPVDVATWPDCSAYAHSWRQLSFMEAASTAVLENDGRLLGGVAVRFTSSELSPGCVLGIFDVPSDLAEAHQLRLRADDLLCLRWQPEALARSRQTLVTAAFRALASGVQGGRLGLRELRKLAEFTGFEGDDEEWKTEYASLCRELEVTEEEGLDLRSFEHLVDDTSERGCFCSDAELQELVDSLGHAQHRCGGAEQPIWVAHATVESADKFGDSLQVKFRLGEEDASLMPSRLLTAEAVPGFSIELLWLPETYHYQASALADLPSSAALVRDLILFGGVRVQRPGNDGGSRSSARDLSHFHLNDSQMEAVRSALESPATLIHGPPGTGKTRTAAVVALAFASQNAQSSSGARACVLYAANSNRAVDVAAEAIMELSTERLEDLYEMHAQEDEQCAICWGDGCNAITFCGHVFHRHCLSQALRAAPGGRRNCPVCRAVLKSIDGVRLLRVYSSDTESLEFPIPRTYRYDGVRERRRAAVPEEMRRFALHWRIHNKVANHFNPRAAACEAAYEKLAACDPHGADFEAARAAYFEARQEARTFELQSCNILLATNCSCRRSWIPQMLQKEGVELRQVLVDECGTSPEPETLCPLTLSKSVQRIVLVGDYRQLRPVVKNRDAGSLGLARSLFERLSTQESPLPEPLKATRQETELQSRQQLVEKAFRALLAGAVHAEGVVERLGLQELRPFAEFTGWEGSDAEWEEEFRSLCAYLGSDPACGLGLDAFNALVDDVSEQGCQCSDEELCQLAGVSAPRPSFGVAPALDEADLVIKAPSSVLLRQQYRMHPSMNNFPSREFYGGKVFSDQSTKERPAGMLVHGSTGARSPLLFWTSSPSFREEVQEVATRDSSTRSKANFGEAERCARLAADIASRAGPRSVAVLSWYNAQVVQLKSALRSLGCRGVHVGSVVTAQGSEWDYVLLSTVLGPSSTSEAVSRLGSLADKHLLNVAVSRGRVGLVVLGCPEVLKTDRHWAAFLEHCKSLGGVLEDWDAPGLSSQTSLPSDPKPGVPATFLSCNQARPEDAWDQFWERWRQRKIERERQSQQQQPSALSAAAVPEVVQPRQTSSYDAFKFQ
eukprot:TRINITY_DN42557_c0_g1_i1.p1 TRINITY_DN42557_c0_g1~~TRINITY_DN42557_c0_g1_i1.p1  ORF type:complete len:1363 (-),score=285.37 TRINITY_DN42557_c0_g1_i1:47-4135(-)